MIDYVLDEENLLIEVRPQSSLTEEDFNTLTKTIDPLLAKAEKLNGIIIETEKFPGWKNWAAFSAHVKFVKNHHKRVKKVALVTNSKFAIVAEKIISHFVKATIKKFPTGEFDTAKSWILE